MSTASRAESKGERLLDNNLLEAGVDLGGHLTLGDLLEEVLLGRLEVEEEVGLPLSDVVDGDTVEETVDTSAAKGQAIVVSFKEYSGERVGTH